MNSKIKQQWLEALRSGEYKQGSGCLKSDDEFCCLGVLSDIYAKQKDLEWSTEFYEKDPDDKFFDTNKFICGKSALPPSPVCKWAELQNSNPEIYVDDYMPCSIAGMNDAGYSFSEIADAIEEQL